MSDQIQLESQELVCEDCKQFFEFTGSEQEFYVKMKFVKPKRCKGCRADRKQRISSK